MKRGVIDKLNKEGRMESRKTVERLNSWIRKEE